MPPATIVASGTFGVKGPLRQQGNGGFSEAGIDMYSPYMGCSLS